MERKGGLGLPSGPQGNENEEQLDQARKEAEYLDFFAHVPGADAEIEDVGNHPWHRLFLEGPISAQK